MAGAIALSGALGAAPFVTVAGSALASAGIAGAAIGAVRLSIAYLN